MKIIWLVNLAILCSFIKVFEIPSMIPIFVEELDFSYSQAGMFMAAYAFIKCLASLPGGSITDKWGAVPVIAVCLFFIGIFGFLGTFGSNYDFLLLFRILVSIGVAFIFVAGVDAIPKYVPAEDVGKGIGYINGSLNVGIALTLFMTPILADSIGWRWTARLYSFSFIALFIFLIPLLKNPPKPIKANESDNKEDSLSITELLTNPSVMLLCAAAFIMFIELYGALTWIPVFLAEVYNYSPAEVGTSATMLGIAAIPASLITGYLSTNLKRIIWLSVSGGMIAGVGILALIAVEHMPLWLAVATTSALTWGHTQITVCLMSIAAIIVPTHSSGKALGLIFTFGYGGSLVPTYLGGYLLEKTGQYDLAFIIFSVSAFVSIIAMVAVGKLLQKNPPAHFQLKMGT